MNKKVISFITVITLLIIVTIFSLVTGSLEVTVFELIRGIFTGDNENVQIIKDLRFPRIIIALFAGAALSVSGVLLQAVMKNPLADPSIIGVSSGAGFMSLLVVSIFPSLFFYMPLFSFIGGAFAFYLVYRFSWKSGLEPTANDFSRCGHKRCVYRVKPSFKFHGGSHFYQSSHNINPIHEKLERCQCHGHLRINRAHSSIFTIFLV